MNSVDTVLGKLTTKNSKDYRNLQHIRLFGDFEDEV